MTDTTQLTQKEARALRAIRNHCAHFGMMPSFRELMREMGFKSPRSASVVVRSLIDKQVLTKAINGGIGDFKDGLTGSSNAYTVGVPLVGTVSCGSPLFAEENLEYMVQVSTDLAKPGHRYFMLRATGDSMNEAGINDGDLVLVRQQPTAEPGDRVVALIDDSATIKEFHQGMNAAVLLPRSSNKEHRPIVVSDVFSVQGVVVATVPEQVGIRQYENNDDSRTSL